MQVLLRYFLPPSEGRGLYAVSMLLLCLDGINFAAFVVTAIVGLASGVTDPFPHWFKIGVGVCFFSGLGLTLLALPLLAFSKERQRALLAAGFAFGTVMFIAFLTSRG